MRRIGTFNSEAKARRFADYLSTQSIDAVIDAHECSASSESGTDTDVDASDQENGVEQWDLWIRDESDVARAKDDWVRFRDDPEDHRFNVASEAARLRDERVERERARIAEHRQTRDSRRQSEPAANVRLDALADDEIRQKKTPITVAIIVISVIISFTTNFGSPRGSALPGDVTLEKRAYNELSFVDRPEYARTGGDAFASIRRGQVWRLVTPLFLHGDEFHLAFNMLWIYFLGSVIERIHGSFVFLAIVLLTQIAGMLLQVAIPPLDWIPESLHGSPFAIGASGAVYGLFGFLWIRPMVDSDYPITMDPMNVVLMLGWLLACMTPLITSFANIANGAHLGGFIAGLLAGAMGYFAKR